MAVRPGYLVDKSALARFHLESVRAVLGPLLTQGRLATCAIVDLGVLFSARTADEYEYILDLRRNNYTTLSITQDVCARAVDVQHQFSRQGQHRAAGIPDLLIAACAELHGITVLHYDHDFELIASITGQPVQWVVPRGSA